MSYEDLLIEADRAGLIVKEKNLPICKGRIKGKRIAIRRNIPTLAEKACVLAEEIDHYHTAAGNILDQSNTANRKQERAGKIWAYDKQIGLSGIIQGYHAKCQNNYELAEYLGVTESFLQDALDYYREKYGTYTEIDGYAIQFEPHLIVTEKRKKEDSYAISKNGPLYNRGYLFPSG